MTTSRTQRSVSPPDLSRCSTPETSSPPTPVFQSAFLSSSPKMAQQKPQVGFASPVATSAYRIPAWDERSVMRAFAHHAAHCETCCSPERVVREGQTLCLTGTSLAKDIGQYFFCWDGRPYSHIDRRQKRERVQVEVPAEYAVVKNLFVALSQGLKFASMKKLRPEVHQTRSTPAPVRATTMTESFEIKPSTTSSPRHRANTYTGYGDVEYETRTPHDDVYRSSSDSKSRESRHEPRRETKRGSLYVPEERRNKRKSYVVPFSSGWLR